MKEINRDIAKNLIAESMLDEAKCDIEELKINFPYYDYSDEIIEFLHSKETQIQS